ncbi:hypothetical protein [Nocardiopsis alba]|uniref:hypothetical protein n=1 Tax=Nocardiopsis alba TaxID=53437 RepID=UPI0036280CBA
MKFWPTTKKNAPPVVDQPELEEAPEPARTPAPVPVPPLFQSPPEADPGPDEYDQEEEKEEQEETPKQQEKKKEEQKEPAPPRAAPVEPDLEMPSQEQVGRWPWLTRTRIMVGAAVVPSVLSLVWLATSVAQWSAGPDGEITIGGIATGVFVDVLIVSTVVVGWVMPSVRRLASIGSWIAAAGAAWMLAQHYWGTEQIYFAAVPLAAKFLWHLALTARTIAERNRARHYQGAATQAQEEEQKELEEAAADDCSLTLEQRRMIADLKRDAEFTRLKAEAEAARDTAEIEAENKVDMARDRAEADQLRARYALADQVGRRLPISILSQLIDLPEIEVNEVQQGRAGDRSELEAAPAETERAELAPAAGFGAGLAEARNGIGGIGADLRTAPSPGTAPTGGGNGSTGMVQPHHAARRAAGQATRDRVLAAIKQYGPEISTNALAAELGLSRTTVRDHRKALARAGENVMPDRQQ